ncbi:MAG TPA: LacI family DNA-binding transcriptional regulator [Nocardioidaceae bacterium]|nr:LacI family DNA-binding transcriptional regulator [Nocardioidaceae bacterium]
MQRVTLKEVAERAGVHPATASRALNAATRSLVNAQTAARVDKAAKQLGYTPNSIARSLKTSRSSTIGLLLPDLTNPLFPPIVRGVEDVLRAVGYSPWIINTDNEPDREAAAIESFRGRSVDGFVVATARLQDPLLEEVADSGTPLVLVNRRVASPDIPSVTGDDAAGVNTALRHLYELGHRDIVHLAGPQDLSTGLARRQAFRQAMEDLGLPDGPDRIADAVAWSEPAGAEAMQSIIDRQIPYTAVLAGNDLIALGCYDVLQRHGLHCPKDVSVVGFNDMPFIDRVAPPLTSVRVPHYEIGAEAARLLLEVLEDPERHPRSVVLPLTLSVRGSTAPPPG